MSEALEIVPGEDLDDKIAALYRDPTRTYDDIAAEVGRSKDYVQARLKRMRRQGIVQYRVVRSNLELKNHTGLG